MTDYHRNQDAGGFPKAELYDAGIPLEDCLNCREGFDCRMASNAVESCPKHPEHDNWREKQRQYKAVYRRKVREGAAK